MIKFSVAISLLVLFSVANSSPLLNDGWEGRIVGGQTASAGQFPYQVSLRSLSVGGIITHFCGGWIHSTRWLISAAHCTTGRNSNGVLVFVDAFTREDGTRYNVSRIVNHLLYNSRTLANDISLVQTSQNIIYGDRVKPIPLGSADPVLSKVNVVVSGWGHTSYPGSPADELQFLTTQTISNEMCRSLHTDHYTQFLHESSICTFNSKDKGNCMGDSGGPLISEQGFAVGVVSWGVACAVGFPDVYTRVSSYYSWLTRTTIFRAPLSS